MDKRKNKIFIVCLSFFVVLSIGYAAFSENVSVSGTSKSQASFNITTTCTKGLPSNIQAAIGLSDLELFTLNRGYKNDTCSVSGNNVTIGATFEYPTASRLFTIKMTNNSSMDAMLYIDDENGYQTAGQIVATTSNGSYTYNFGENIYTYAASLWTNTSNYGTAFFEDTSGNLNAFSGDKNIYYNSNGYYIKLSKNESIYLVFISTMSSNWDSSYDDYTVTATETFTFPFVQYTIDMKQTTLN